MSKINPGKYAPILTQNIPDDITFSEFYQIYFHDMEVRLKPSSLSSKKHIFADKILPFSAHFPCALSPLITCENGNLLF